MGISTNAYLMYGYELGGSDVAWKVQQVDEDGTLTVDWVDQGDGDFEEAAMQQLRAAAGFAETDWQVDGFFARQREADARLGVSFETHCHSEYPVWVLCAKRISAYRGESEPIDFDALAAQAAAEDWDGKLAAALAVLGLTPTQERPQWLLASYWG